MIYTAPISTTPQQWQVMQGWRGLEAITSSNNPAFQLALVPGSTEPDGPFSTLWDATFLQAYQYDKLSQQSLQQAQLQLALTEAQIPMQKKLQQSYINSFKLS
ncbi:MAG: hypothetical protein ACKO37_01170 [Vampirovibrionales bacterium]